ncbi:sulfite exporter TauE/SafE family protein [Rhizobium sp. BK376]|uniref:sulfite exporter TauE/SafE family protein n=1 Tax=Rhizobium sp. BK376 TaxID=2512149 RepID=UPI001051A911|nr:sulfite exporter TauE/SafE family protein [Rhizobium sp. BK376]TCR79586.1 hypothetical protein EV561_11584 [Rhizobium sp. BK376]
MEWHVFWLFMAAFSSSLVGGLLGMSSGIFVVPLLTIAFGMSIRTAVGVSLVSVIACSCASAAPFLKSRLTNVRLAVVLEGATTSGALAGVLLSGVMSTGGLYVLFAAVLLASAWQMVRRRAAIPLSPLPVGDWSSSLALHSSYTDRHKKVLVNYTVGKLPLGLGLMFFAGLLSALLGIGSGVLKIPAMDTALRLPLRVSSATSNFMIGVTATASAGPYFLRGGIDPSVAGPIILGSVLGALLGAKLLLKLPVEMLRRAFAAILLILACQMLTTGLAFCFS